MMYCDKISAWFGALRPQTTSPFFGAICGIEEAWGSHEPTEKTLLSKLCDEY